MLGPACRRFMGLCDRTNASWTSRHNIAGGSAMGLAFENAFVSLILNSAVQIQPIDEQETCYMPSFRPHESQ